MALPGLYRLDPVGSPAADLEYLDIATHLGHTTQHYRRTFVALGEVERTWVRQREPS